MEINRNFYLYGFQRCDKGEDGAVFLHYSEQKDERKAEINASPIYYGGSDTVNYSISIPKPKEKLLTGCAIVTRSSKNIYQATVFDETRIESFRAEALGDLNRMVEKFFKGGKT